MEQLQFNNRHIIFSKFYNTLCLSMKQATNDVSEDLAYNAATLVCSDNVIVIIFFIFFIL